MFSVLLFSFNAIFPIIAIIFLGVFFKKKGLFTDEFLKVANKFVFTCIMPVLIGKNIYDIHALDDFRWDIAIFATVMLIILFGVGIIISIIFFKESGQRAVITQCTFRANYILLGLPLVANLVGSDNITSASIISTFSVPTVNILSIISLTMYSDEGNKKGFKQIISEIYRNPIIIGAFIGFICLIIRCFIPVDSAGEPVFTIKNNLPFVDEIASLITSSATFISLVVLGGMIDFSAIHSRLKGIIVGIVVRTVVAPIIGFSALYLVVCCNIISCGPNEYASFIPLFGAPVSVSIAIMSEEMDGDGELARQLVVWTSISSAITLFILVSISKYMGLI